MKTQTSLMQYLEEKYKQTPHLLLLIRKLMEEHTDLMMLLLDLVL